MLLPGIARKTTERSRGLKNNASGIQRSYIFVGGESKTKGGDKQQLFKALKENPNSRLQCR